MFNEIDAEFCATCTKLKIKIILTMEVASAIGLVGFGGLLALSKLLYLQILLSVYCGKEMMMMMRGQ